MSTGTDTIEARNELRTAPTDQFGIIFNGPNAPLEYKKLPMPQMQPDEILVKVLFTGVCHSDYHIWKGDWKKPAKRPLIGGHEGVGVVKAIGNKVSLLSGFQVGGHVAFEVLSK